MDKKEKTSLQCTAKASPIVDSAVLKTNKCCGFFFKKASVPAVFHHVSQLQNTRQHGGQEML